MGDKIYIVHCKIPPPLCVAKNKVKKSLTGPPLLIMNLLTISFKGPFFFQLGNSAKKKKSIYFPQGNPIDSWVDPKRENDTYSLNSYNL